MTDTYVNTGAKYYACSASGRELSAPSMLAWNIFFLVWNNGFRCNFFTSCKHSRDHLGFLHITSVMHAVTAHVSYPSAAHMVSSFQGRGSSDLIFTDGPGSRTMAQQRRNSTTSSPATSKWMTFTVPWRFLRQQRHNSAYMYGGRKFRHCALWVSA